MNNKIKTAGGIVIKDDKILFIKKNGRWDLPKGKMETGVNKRNTAIIEISEETGLPENQLSIITKLIPTHHQKQIEGNIIEKKTYWYLVEFKGEITTTLVPDRQEGITECRWFYFDELMLILEESHERIRYLLDFFLNMAFYKKYKPKLFSG